MNSLGNMYSLTWLKLYFKSMLLKSNSFEMNYTVEAP